MRKVPPIVPQGLPYNPTISLSVRTAGPIAKILFSALLLFLEGLGSPAIRWGREMGRKARIAAAWVCERLGLLFEGRIDCSLSTCACLSGFTQFLRIHFAGNFPVLPPFFAFYLSEEGWQGIILEEGEGDALVRKGRCVARRFLKAVRP